MVKESNVSSYFELVKLDLLCDFEGPRNIPIRFCPPSENEYGGSPKWKTVLQVGLEPPIPVTQRCRCSFCDEPTKTLVGLQNPVIHNADLPLWSQYAGVRPLP